MLLATILCAGISAGLAAEDSASVKDELKAFWREVSRTVNTGDYEGYAALYHPDAVLVVGPAYGKTGQGKSMPIADALAGWKSGFDATKAGKLDANVGFRFSETALGDGVALVDFKDCSRGDANGTTCIE